MCFDIKQVENNELQFNIIYKITFIGLSNLAWWWRFVKPKRVALKLYNNVTQNVVCDWRPTVEFVCFRVPEQERLWGAVPVKEKVDVYVATKTREVRVTLSYQGQGFDSPRNKSKGWLSFWHAWNNTPITVSSHFVRRICLRHFATARKVAGSIPDGVIGILHWT